MGKSSICIVDFPACRELPEIILDDPSLKHQHVFMDSFEKGCNKNNIKLLLGGFNT